MLPFLAEDFPAAILALADGHVFVGQSMGHAGQAVGEVVFNTAMTGYQEILTDPSYCQQIVTLTVPHVGNCGINAEDVESGRIQAAGLVIRDLPPRWSNHRGEQGLGHWLAAAGIVAIAGVDTRQLTRLLRERGAQNGVIVGLQPGEAASKARRDAAVRVARAAPAMSGRDLARVVSTRVPQAWTETAWKPGSGYGQQTDPGFRVVAYDFGIKRNILRLLAERGCAVTVVPAQTPAADVLALRPDGVLLSNGPGDPGATGHAIAAAREIVASGTPTFGICLGHQLAALALGASTFKMAHGHHGVNHPVREVATGRVSITSQNHGFAVDIDTLPANVRVTHLSLFDGSLQGFELTDRPAFFFQGHPEASAGPRDVQPLFDHFIALMQAGQNA
ncbi:MAG: glutamine-hydrolyzing carbamoyl-phosphate synthase small subunit [Ottowia sp.]